SAPEGAASGAGGAARAPAMKWVMEIGDDGRGFDEEQMRGPVNRRHFGLRFMRERSELLGAELAIDTRPGAGTVVRLSIDTRGKGKQSA
ncbi:MAG: hypothetical protein M3N29_11205, partial [Chloroflexota bacterium]|nr:hypothetical protein [Chloroflexota bacterium]